MICTDQVCKSGSSDYASDRMISCPSDHSSHQTTLIARNVPLDKSRPLDQIDDLYEICTILYGSYFLFFFSVFLKKQSAKNTMWRVISAIKCAEKMFTTPCVYTCPAQNKKHSGPHILSADCTRSS